ncbi:MAG: glycosyltransferase [Halanaerobiales bacterium]|nr:glycosyltransferase [Halanaerobiales bacterium]
MKKPQVSIIIPVYNREKLIEETVKSALNQTYQDFEIIIGDNKSTDQSYQILQGLAAHNNKIKVFQNKQNLGPVKNWLECLNRAQGQYIKILFSDDLLADNFLEKTVAILEKNKDVSFVYSKVTIFSEHNRYNAYHLGQTGRYPASIFIDGSLARRYETPLSPGCALFRKRDIVIHQSIPNLLGIDHSKTGAGIDLLIYLEALIKYPYFFYFNQILSFFRAHQQSISISDPNLGVREYHTAKEFFKKRCKFNYVNFKAVPTVAHLADWNFIYVHHRSWQVAKITASEFSKTLQSKSPYPGTRLAVCSAVPNNSEQLVKVQAGSIEGEQVGLAARTGGFYGSRSGYYLALLDGNKLVLRSWLAGQTVHWLETAFHWQARQWYWLKLRCQADHLLLGKAWPDGSPEPDGWMLQGHCHKYIGGHDQGIIANVPGVIIADNYRWQAL